MFCLSLLCIFILIWFRFVNCLMIYSFSLVFIIFLMLFFWKNCWNRLLILFLGIFMLKLVIVVCILFDGVFYIVIIGFVLLGEYLIVFFKRFLRICFSWVWLVFIVMCFSVVFSFMEWLLSLGKSCWIRFFINLMRLMILGLVVLFLVFILLIRRMLLISLIIWFDLIDIWFRMCLIKGFFVCFMFWSIFRLVVNMAIGVWNWWFVIEINFDLSWLRAFCFCCVVCCLWIFL